MVDQNAGDKVKSMGTAMEEAEPGKEQAVMDSIKSLMQSVKLNCHNI